MNAAAQFDLSVYLSVCLSAYLSLIFLSTSNTLEAMMTKDRDSGVIDAPSPFPKNIFSFLACDEDEDEDIKSRNIICDLIAIAQIFCSFSFLMCVFYTLAHTQTCKLQLVTLEDHPPERSGSLFCLSQHERIDQLTIPSI